MRKAEITRKTKETDITLSLALEGGERKIDTGIGFFDHMLNSFAVHGGFGLTLICKGDLEVDGHHTVEDCGIVLGQALAQCLGDKAGIARFGQAFVPMGLALLNPGGHGTTFAGWNKKADLFYSSFLSSSFCGIRCFRSGSLAILAISSSMI